jgi:hypothetical protein
LTHISPYKMFHILYHFTTDITITNGIKFPADERLTTFIPFNHPGTAYQLPAQNANFYE